VSFREWATPVSLAGLVECTWSVDLPTGAAGHDEAILPDGCMDIVWSGTELLVAGPDTRPHPTRRRPGVPTCGLRFAPGRLPALLGVPAAELRDARVPLAELHSRLAARATARLGEAGGPAGVRIRTALAVLAGLATALPGGPPEPAVPVLATGLATGEESVAQLADRLGMTTRTLHRQSLSAFGYGPSVLRRVLRFRRATEMLRAGTAPAWVAAAAGYADQPHLSRELRELGGLAPAQLARGANRSTPLPSGSSTVA
jgi:AraC-like DNA-binding protein